MPDPRDRACVRARTSRRPSPHRRVVVGSLVSAILHTLGVALISYIGTSPEDPPESAIVEFGVAAGAEGEEARQGGVRGPAEELRSGGARSRTNIDAPHQGSGGSRLGPSDVILLLSHAGAVTLQDSPMNAWAVSQTQRIRTEPDRATQERRRATPNPSDEPFLASGDGVHRERRPVAARDARVGAQMAPSANSPGSTPSRSRARWPDNSRARPTAGTSHATRSEPEIGGALSSPGPGIQRGAGRQRTRAARVAHGRPPVDQGPAATPSETVDPRIRDEHDAELLASRLVQSWTEATERRGRVRGHGVGGPQTGPIPGSGRDRETGGDARPFGPGSGRYPSLDTSDDRYQTWYSQVRRRVYSRLAFPRARALAMDQGWSVHRIRVDPRGRLIGVPQLQRSSGFGDLDQAAQAAIVTAAPFPPPPPGLLSENRHNHTLSMRIEHANPMVQ